ncbi:MAG TPA: DUF4142 domain-containing protein [Prolixibacteraceae bacterium]|jgi:putative membrane protein
MKTIIIKLFLLAIPVLMLACGPTNRNKETKKDTYATTADSVNKSAVLVNDNNQNKDLEFIKEAASGGLMEVELGKYAQQNAMTPRVRNFGAMMVKDHTKVNEELMGIVKSKGFNVPTTMDDKHREAMSDIQKKSGLDFDREYMKEMVDDHEKDVDKFKKHAENGVDPDVKTFASKTLPTLLMHQDSAKVIRDAIKKK